MATVTICDWSGCTLAGTLKSNANPNGNLFSVRGELPFPAPPTDETDAQALARTIRRPFRGMGVSWKVCGAHLEPTREWLRKNQQAVQGAFADLDAARLAGDAPADDGNGGEAS